MPQRTIHEQMTAMDDYHRCKLGEVRSTLAREGIRMSDNQIILSAVTESGATSYRLAIDAVHRELLRTHHLPHTRCGTER